MDIKPLNPGIPFRGGMLSVQASEFHYCAPKHNQGPYFNYEVAFMNEKDEFVRIDELGPLYDQVYGNVPLTEVYQLLESEGYTPSQIKKLIP